MHAQEIFSVENDDGNEPNGNRRKLSDGCTLSITTIIVIAILFVCSLISVALIVYNFVTCPRVLHIETKIPCNESHVDAIQITDFNFCYESGNHSDKSISLTETRPLPPGLLHIKQLDKQQENDPNLRLPRSVIPISYNISFFPMLEENNFKFQGNIKIIVKVVEDCYNITLHVAELDIDINKVLIRSLNSSVAPSQFIPISNLNYVEKKQFFEIYFKDKLKKGNVYHIFLLYKGVLTDYLQGFYRSSYWSGNKKRWIAATQFQPTDARRAFPCFDEPALKAKFKINIARPKGMSSISNMPQIRNGSFIVPDLTTHVWDVYEESVPMSTYLVAFAITDFANQTNENNNFTVWARSDAIHSAEYALKIGPKILRFFENFFGIKFPLPKIDMIAVPDFQAGAMENWGLITFRETAMLYDECVSTIVNKQRVATVVAHELAHQWFGNLVTPSWWSDIWLNEGFASYVEYLGVDAVEPSWKSMDQFVINEVQNVFVLDALSSSHKISTEVANPDEINEIFDRISYAKGATIIRMMSHFLSSSIFRNGLRKYLKALSYKSAKQDDLWKFLTDEAFGAGLFDDTISVKEIMDTWTLQTGFPVVTVQTDVKTNSINLHQERFTYMTKNKTKDESLWWIPITYTFLTEFDFAFTRPTYWMRKTRTLSIQDPRNDSSTEWLVINIQQTGYYRVNYDTNNWKLLINYLRDVKKFRKIPPITRAQLIDDALNLARGGKLSYHIALDITQYLKHEDNYIPWKAAITALNFIDSMLIRDGDYHLFKKYVLKLIEKMYKKVGFEDKGIEKDLLKIYMRSDILTTACHLGHSECISKCLQRYHNWMFGPSPDTQNPISPNLKSLVYCMAIQHGTEKEWDFAYERYIRTNVSSEKEILLTSLTCSKETWILNRLFRRALSSDEIRKQDIYKIFAAVSGNVVGQPIAFSFLRNCWGQLDEHLGSSLTNLNTIIKYITRRMNKKSELNEVKRFFRQYHRLGGRPIQQVIEQIEVNIHWKEVNYKKIINWLKNVDNV